MHRRYWVAPGAYRWSSRSQNLANRFSDSVPTTGARRLRSSSPPRITDRHPRQEEIRNLTNRLRLVRQGPRSGPKQPSQALPANALTPSSRSDHDAITVFGQDRSRSSLRAASLRAKSSEWSVTCADRHSQTSARSVPIVSCRTCGFRLRRGTYRFRTSSHRPRADRAKQWVRISFPDAVPASIRRGDRRTTFEILGRNRCAQSVAGSRSPSARRAPWRCASTLATNSSYTAPRRTPTRWTGRPGRC